MSNDVSAVVDITIGSEQASGVLIAPDEVLTVAHIISSIGATASITLSTGAVLAGVATHAAEAPAGATEIIGTIPNDYAVIHLNTTAPTWMPLTLGVTDGMAATKIGYPGTVIAGQTIATGHQASTAVTMQTTQIPGLVVDDHPQAAGSSGSAIVSNGGVVAIASGADSTYAYDVQMTPSTISNIATWMATDHMVGSHSAAAGNADAAYVAQLVGLIQGLPHGV